MPLPLVHLLEEPTDNELKLWGMLRQLRMGLVGQGGPLSGWGFTSGDDGAGVGGIAGEVVYLGAFGQLTVDGTCLLFENSALKRVGVNTCAPQYPLDINSNECDAKIVAIRNGNADADVDMFANYDAAPGARVRLSRTDDGVSDPTFQLRFYTNEDIAGVNTMHERLSLSKVVDVKTGFALSGDITVNLTVDQNNWDPPGLETAAVIRISTTGNRNITGLSRGTDGAVKIIRNVDVSESVTLVNQSASSITVNRFSLGANLVIPPGGTVILLYDITISRWINAAGTASTGSGITNRIAYWVTPTVLGAVNEFTNVGQIMFTDDAGPRLPKGSNNLLWDQVNNRLRIGSLFLPLNGLDLQSGTEALSTLAISHESNNNFTSANVEGFRLTASGSLLVNTPLISIRGGGNHISSPTGRSIQGRMEVRSAETWSASVRGAYIAFQTTPIGSLTMAQRFVVGPSGEWGIGGTTFATTAFGTAGQVFTSGGTSAAPTWTTPTTGVTDHGALTGLGDDDHTIYFLLAGRSGGQTAIGGTGVADGITLQATSGVGANAEFIRGVVGNNGSLEMFRASTNSGFFIGNGTSPGTALAVATTGSGFPGGDWIAWFRRESSAGANESIIRHQHFGNDQGSLPIFAGFGARGSNASPTGLSANDHLLVLDGRGYDGSAVNHGEYAVGWSDTAAQIAFRAGGTWSGTDHESYITFHTTPDASIAPVERLRIASTGFIGHLGYANNPFASFVAASDADYSMILDSYNSAGSSAAIIARRARGSQAAPTAVQSGDVLFTFQARGDAGSGFVTAGGALNFVTTQNWTGGAQGTAISFNYTQDGTTAQTTVAQFTTPADTETAFILQRNIGGVFSLQRVSVGGAGSAGMGFRILRVPD